MNLRVVPLIRDFGAQVAAVLALLFCIAQGARPFLFQNSSGPAEAPAVRPISRRAPEFFRGIYLTSWSAGTKTHIGRAAALGRSGLINTVVLDIKDSSGYVAYDSAVPDVSRFRARRVLIKHLDPVIAELHAAGLYVIARMEVFQDPRLALARPDLAVHQAAGRENAGSEPDARKLDGAGPDAEAARMQTAPPGLWQDRKHLLWVDPAAREAWGYGAAIAQEALRRGFDEVNFDYVRFPSDGNLEEMEFGHWDGKTPRHEIIARFFAFLRGQMPDAALSADLFGLATINHDDLGIGQIIEDAYKYFDYVCPMVYPSHYAAEFLGFRNPAEHPFEVVHYSLASARRRLAEMPRQPRNPKIRPWLQNFNLGAVYTPEMVEAQAKAAQEALGSGYCGYILWNPSNVYSEAVLTRLKSVVGAASGPAAAGRHGADAADIAPAHQGVANAGR